MAPRGLSASARFVHGSGGHPSCGHGTWRSDTMSRKEDGPKACFRCSSPDHLVASCSKPRYRKPQPRPPSPSFTWPRRTDAPAPASMSFLGHPTTREEEDSCYIATSYDLGRQRLDWESTAIVAWVISAPSGMDRTDVDDAFRRKFRLRESELMVSSHYPEQFLIKFANAKLRDEVLRTERCCFKKDGLDIHFRPWRAVSHAYNADLHFRVHVVVDGPAPFAWRPEVVICSWAVNVRFNALMMVSQPWRTPPPSECGYGRRPPLDSEGSLVHAGQQRGRRPLLHGIGKNRTKRGISFACAWHHDRPHRRLHRGTSSRWR
ncbi:hypothetical protein QYE76_066971 [Lolium multiflorum]|uniref:Uncharacterized protein n=1 Tax=Lolium multiflorum TaxID=4521 RepID=A0AAD8SD42_LOLMU|nr:hypothetical protein QYE76_066971 [Lolium multiflorum]